MVRPCQDGTTVSRMVRSFEGQTQISQMAPMNAVNNKRIEILKRYTEYALSNAFRFLVVFCGDQRDLRDLCMPFDNSAESDSIDFKRSLTRVISTESGSIGFNGV